MKDIIMVILAYLGAALIILLIGALIASVFGGFLYMLAGI